MNNTYPVTSDEAENAAGKEFVLCCDRPEPIRLDRFLAEELTELSRSAAASLIEQGHVLVNGKARPKSYMLSAGMKAEVFLPAPKPAELTPENIPLDILYEDAHLLVINKPKGMVVHPAPGHYEGTLVHALLYHCGDSLAGIGGTLRPGIVHRIDRLTSGLLLAAKTDAAHLALSQQIAAHSLLREYEAVVHGQPGKQSGTIDAPIGRHPVKRKQMAVNHKNGRPAVTHYELITTYPKHAHLRLRLETGRTHQIRVHLASVGHPVLGDEVYCAKKAFPGLEGQCLHAKKVGFIHPATGGRMEFDSPLPDYFKAALRRI